LRATLRVLQLGRAIVDEILHLIDNARPPFPNASQLRRSAEGITLNIREGLGRRWGPDRVRFFEYSSSSAEETDESLRNNFRSGRIKASVYWRLRNRIILLTKMLGRMMRS